MPDFDWVRVGYWIAAIGGAALMMTANAVAPTHLLGKPCADCHLAGNIVAEEDASMLMASQESLCGRSCHSKAIQLSHPSGFAPDASLPVDYPVDWKGDLTCSTCHLAHGSGQGLLRGQKRGKDMCLSCHEPAFFRSMKDLGTSIVQSGHLVSRATLDNIELDRFSLHCLGCHSGEYSAPVVEVDQNGILRHGSGRINHPIGRLYGDSVRFGGYRPESSLSKNILLPDGKISCVSCHQAYNQDHGKLVVSNSQSSTCFECHDL